MKKLIFIFLLLSGISSVYAKNITISNSITTGSTIILDEGANYLENQFLNKKIGFNTHGNNNLEGITNGIYVNNKDYSIEVTCKNGYITYLSGYKLITDGSATGNLSNLAIESLNLSVGSGASEDDWTNDFVTIKCKPITQPEKVLEQNVINANYQTISKPSNDPFTESYNLSTSSNPTINEDSVTQHLLPGKDIKNQPTFIDILFLQLQTIGNLSNTLITKNPNIEFKNLFKNTNEFNEYSKWINKFKNFSNLNDFVNAFTGTVGLKDIGIANDVINGLLKCLNTNDCNGVISFQHNPLDKFDVYKFTEIENTLYQKPGNENILSGAIIFYKKMKKTCEHPPAINGDQFLTNQIKYTCNALLSGEINSANQSQITNFQLGYALGVRIKNLNNIKENIPTSGINLKGIYNIFRELNNLTLGTQKIQIIQKVNEEPTLTGKYEEFKKAFQNDLKELQKKKFFNSETISKKSNITMTIIKALTPGNKLYLSLKSNKPNINLLNNNNYEINDGKVIIKGTDIVENNDNIQSNNSNISGAELEIGPWGLYKNLKITYKDGSSKNFVKVFRGLYVEDYWLFPEGTYYDAGIINDFNICRTDFYKNKNYYKCIKKAKKNHQKVIVYCKWFNCYVKEK